MAKAGEMIKVIANALVRPQATVTSYYAALRKAGLISTTGRGKSAQDLSSLDVARILIVMLSAESLNDSELITELVGNLLHAPVNDTYDNLLKNITKHKFEDCLANIITDAADYHHKRKSERYKIDEFFYSQFLEIEVSSTKLTAEIVLNEAKLQFLSIDLIEFISSSKFNLCQIRTSEETNKDRIFKKAALNGMVLSRKIDSNIIYTIAKHMP